MSYQVQYKKCPFCGTNDIELQRQDDCHIFANCPTCGKFLYNERANYSKDAPRDKNKLASFLFYNGKVLSYPQPDHYNAVVNTAKYNELIEQGLSYSHVTDTIVENWFPKTFKEKVDMFLLMLSTRSNYIGEFVSFSQEELLSASFAVREIAGRASTPAQLDQQRRVFINYLKDRNYIKFHNGTQIELLVEGWKRVDELQKHNADSKSVFIAMSFAKEMDSVREAIKVAVIECGYTPKIMDEIEHNHQIVPEMLYEIRQAKFVIAEITKHNNGAYFEAGYALGNGKEVIQLCKEDTFGDDGHFDVKQVNTILWKNEEDLKLRLVNRIKATIG